MPYQLYSETLGNLQKLNNMARSEFEGASFYDGGFEEQRIIDELKELENSTEQVVVSVELLIRAFEALKGLISTVRGEFYGTEVYDEDFERQASELEGFLDEHGIVLR